jgi:hypothetical protein
MKKSAKKVFTAIMSVISLSIGTCAYTVNAAQPSNFYANAKWYDQASGYSSAYVKTSTSTSAFLNQVYTTSGSILLTGNASYNWFVEEGNYPMYQDYFNMYYNMTSGPCVGYQVCIRYYPDAYSGAGKLQLTHVYKR